MLKNTLIMGNYYLPRNCSLSTYCSLLELCPETIIRKEPLLGLGNRDS